MRVQVALRSGRAIRRRLVKTHRIRKRNFEEIIVAHRRLAQDICQAGSLRSVKSVSEPRWRREITKVSNGQIAQ